MFRAKLECQSSRGKTETLLIIGRNKIKYCRASGILVYMDVDSYVSEKFNKMVGRIK
jgi:predicted glycosyltransferase involved in capsule biosynthesis